MKIKLVSYTRPTDELKLKGINTIQELIAYCARVSNPTNQYNSQTSGKLIEYLIKNKHWSPLEQVDVTIEVETTRDIARQMLRHKSMSFQEFSQRYSDPTMELSFMYREARLQDSKNRQNSIEIDDYNLQLEWVYQQEEVLNKAREAYQWAIDRGIAKEVARAVLPEGLTMTRLYCKNSIRGWIHYLEVRTDESTQKEHREVAIACAKAIAEIFPMVEKFIPITETGV